MPLHNSHTAATLQRMVDRGCNISSHDGDNPWHECERTVAATMIQTVQDLIDIIEFPGSTEGEVKDAYELLKSHSQHPGMAYYYKEWSFGGGPDC